MRWGVSALIDEFLKEIQKIHIGVSAEFISLTIFEKTLLPFKSRFLGERKSVPVLHPLALILRVSV